MTVKAIDIEFGRIVAWLRKNRLQCHTDRAGKSVIRIRAPRRSRLTGAPR